MRKFRIINSLTPVRICDIGGWTDTWFSGHGMVLNIASQPYIEVQLTVTDQIADENRVLLQLDNFDDSYSINPDVPGCIRHPLIETTINNAKMPEDISLKVNVFSTVPSGASVGTSAAVVVGLIAGLQRLSDKNLSSGEIAAGAHAVETESLNLQSGIQDQICCAHGGVNFINMKKYPESQVEKLFLKEELKLRLENQLLLVFVGKPHNSSKIHDNVIADLGKNAKNDLRIDTLRRLALAGRETLLKGDLEGFGNVMNENTEVQKKLHSGLVGEKFEEVINIGRSFDVLGVKVNGAGGDGGSVTILCDGDNSKKRKLVRSLQLSGHSVVPVKLCDRGVTVWEDGDTV